MSNYGNRTRYQPYEGQWSTTYNGITDGQGSWTGTFPSHTSVKNGQGYYNYKGGRAVLKDTGTSYLREEAKVYVSVGDEIKGTYSRLDLFPVTERGMHVWGKFDIGSPWTVSLYPGLSGSVIDEAKTDFLKRVYQVGTTFNGYTLLGEARQAIAMIRRPLAAFRSGWDEYLNAIRKMKRRRGRHSVAALNKAVASTYLEYTFGWDPLIGDLKDAAKAVADRLNHIPESEDVWGKAVGRMNVEGGSGFFHQNVGDLQVGFDYKAIETHEVNAKFKGGYSGRNDMSGVQADFGFHPRNFIPTIWEVIPYSFLIDYFVNIGEYLEGLCAGTSNVWYCCQNLKYVAKRTVSQLSGSIVNIENSFPFATKDIVARCSDYTIERSWFSRQVVIADQLRPSLRTKFPRLFSKQSLNITALVAQARSVEKFLQG